MAGEHVAVWVPDGTPAGGRWVSIRGEAGAPGAGISLKGTVPDAAALPTTGTDGDAYIAADTGHIHTWSSATSAWVDGGRIQGPTGPAGAKGDKGDAGTPGLPGTSATITVGTVNTGIPGSKAAVTNTGTPTAATFNFSIPTGATGATGATGPAPTMTVASTTGTPAGNPASVSIAATAPGAYGLSFVIPSGATGPAGSSITYKGTALTWPPATPAKGDTWAIGTPAPAGAPAPAGHVVTYDGTTWHDGGSIKGDKGDPGPVSVSVDAGNVARLGADGLLFVPAGSVPLATKTTAGAVIVGSGLTVDATGKLDALATAVPVATTTTTGTVTLADANAITTKATDRVVSAAQLMGQVEVKAPLAGPSFTGQVTLQPGTAALPSLSFTADTNTGVFSPGNDKLTIVTGGSAVVEFSTQLASFPAGVTIGGMKYPRAAAQPGQVLMYGGTANQLTWGHAYTDSDGAVFAKPGDDLAEKYLLAVAKTPGGNVQTATNRAALIIAPGTYTLPADLAIDTDYVDVIGLGSSPHNPAVFINGATVHVQAEDVCVTGLSVGTQAFKVDGHPTPTPTQRISNCVGGDGSFGTGGIASGSFSGCLGGARSFGSFGVLNGFLYECRLTSGTFPTVTAPGITRNCINADGTIDNQGGYYGTDVSTAPTDGQAWVWNSTLKKWKPGSVASGFTCADGTTKKTLDDVADLLRVFAGCAANQPLKPDGTKATGWEAVAVKSAEYVKTLPDGTVVAVDPDALVLVYDTTYDPTGNLEVFLPIGKVSAVNPNVVIDWGDGTAKQTVTAAGNIVHAYAKHGRYVVSVKGTMDWFGTQTDDPRRVKLAQCLSWGKTGLVSLSYAFKGASKMNALVPSPPKTVTSVVGMFFGCTSFNQSLSNFDASAIWSMSQMFFDCSSFNQPIGSFKTGSCEQFSQMFANCTSFNQPVVGFDTSRAINMSSMFYGCRAFNQPVLSFVTSSVTNMNGMFRGCSAFDQDVSNFNTAAVTDFGNMFYGCTVFNRPVANFNTANATNMSGMFQGCAAFNQSLSHLSVRKVVTSTANTGLDNFATSAAALTTANIDAVLKAWDADKGNNAHNNHRPTFAKPCSAAGGGVAARDALKAAGWSFTMPTDI